MRRKSCIVLLVFLFWLTACEASHQLGEKEKQQNGNGNENNQKETETTIYPIDIDEQFFQNIAGWYDESNILYIQNKPNLSEIIRYNLFNGQSSTFFVANTPIMQVVPSPDRNIFLVHLSPNHYQATILFIDRHGNELFKWEVGSYELHFAWNPYHSQQILVTSFLEDWSFETYLIDLAEQRIEKNVVEAPFVQWSNQHQFTYIKWDEEEPELSAPLFLYDLLDRNEKKIADHVIGHVSAGPFLLYLQENLDEKGKGQYVFLRFKDLQKLSFFDVSLISEYSGWLFPYFDVFNKRDEFYTFVPMDTTENNTSFHLINIQIKTGKKNELVKNIANEPISISPSGQYILYGYRFEKLIDIKDRKMINLIQ
ncbi:hypothetical protein [Bacillus alveayuensis]|uniref:YqgU-like beta propeller domain-containing protein n=1 Tax=Aeribacillus alveayuensis TaxID=279215 RepID=UPI0005D10CCA|nr:hypothetical protein [Bacillus alveayuensis]